MLLYVVGCLGSVSVLNRGGGAGYIRIRRLSSKRFPERTYRSTDEFWQDHYDPVGAKVAQLIEQQGYVAKKKCYLESDGKVLVQEKHFPSKAHFVISEQAKARITVPDFLNEISVQERTVV